MSKYISRTYKYQEATVLCAEILPGTVPTFKDRIFIVDASYDTDAEIIADIASRMIPGCTPCQVKSRVLKAEKRRMLMSDFIRGSELVCEVNPESVKDED